MATARVFNISNDNIEERIRVLRTVCGMNLVDPQDEKFRFDGSKNRFIEFIKTYNEPNPLILFIHNSDASMETVVNALSECDKNFYAIFYSGGGINNPYELNENLHIKSRIKYLKSSFPTEFQDNLRYELLKNAVQAAAVNNLKEFSSIDVNTSCSTLVSDIVSALQKSIDIVLGDSHETDSAECFGNVKVKLEQIVPLDVTINNETLTTLLLDNFVERAKFAVKPLLENTAFVELLNIIYTDGHDRITNQLLTEADEICQELSDICS